MAKKQAISFGRVRGPVNPKVPHWRTTYIQLGSPDLPKVPKEYDYTKGVNTFGEMGNDYVGDCTCAAFYHARQIWALATNQANASSILTLDGDANAKYDSPTPPDAITLYSKITGYNPKAELDAHGKNPTDKGANEWVVLQYLASKGAPVGNQQRSQDILSAFFHIDQRIADDMKRVIWECGVAYIGFQMPMSWRKFKKLSDLPPVWDAPANFSDPPDQDPSHGHAVVLVGFDGNGYKAISWGRLYTLTSSFVETYVDTAFALVDQLWLTNSKHTPLGMTQNQLNQIMAQLRMAPDRNFEIAPLVINAIALKAFKPVDVVKPEDKLKEDLGMHDDSIQKMYLDYTNISNQFGGAAIRPYEAGQCLTVQDAINLVYDKCLPAA